MFGRDGYGNLRTVSLHVEQRKNCPHSAELGNPSRACDRGVTSERGKVGGE